MVKRVVVSWSTGKDAAWALHVLRKDPSVEVVGLLTTSNEAFDRTAMHGVRRELLRLQAEAVGLPVLEAMLPWPCSNEQYEARMTALLAQVRQEWNPDAVAFGDLYLEDVRAYREEKMAGTGLEPLFPVWGLPTRELAFEMVRSGVRAKVSCIDSRKLPDSFAGREFDESFLNDLPDGIDPCAESGEFHTCVYDGPAFLKPVPVRVGEIVQRDGFVYADVIPLSLPE